MQRSSLALVILLVCSGAAVSQQTQRQAALRQIIAGHYVFSSGTFNSGIIVTSEGVVVLDALNSEAVGRAERDVLVDIRDAVQYEVGRGSTEDQAVAAIRWPQYEKMQGYNAQREVAVRRLYQQLTGALQ